MFVAVARGAGAFLVGVSLLFVLWGHVDLAHDVLVQLQAGDQNSEVQIYSITHATTRAYIFRCLHNQMKIEIERERHSPCSLGRACRA